jgi:Ribosomal L22e protein family
MQFHTAGAFWWWTIHTSHCLLLSFLLQVAKKPGTKKVANKATLKGASKGGNAGSKKKKTTLKYTIDCTHPVEDGIMDPSNFVSIKVIIHIF